MTTAFITHRDCLKHETPPGHPEQVARLKYILEATKDLDLLRIEAPLATQKNILSVHPQSHIDLINASSPEDGRGDLWPRAPQGRQSRRSCGSWRCYPGWSDGG